MTVKQIVAECVQKMGLDNFLDNQTYTSDEQKLVARLVFNVNVVYREIVSAYLPLVDTADVSVVGGELAFSSLQNVRILYPIRLVAGDNEINFKSYATKIKCDYSGAAKLTYAYLPSTDFVLTDTITDARITSSVLASGVLAEYYFQNKVFDLAKNFDSEFREEIARLKYKGRSMFLKERRW
ncbi:MAG: hypothetical protein J5815_03215 [Clostridia bacterium]|nr:hypothetical protein [Clostridia bacterium]